MTPAIEIKSLTLRDGRVIKIGRGEIVVVVGPNNAGKTELLRSIATLIGTSATTNTLKSVQIEKHGSWDEVREWISSHCRSDESWRTTSRLGVRFDGSNFEEQLWKKNPAQAGDTTPFFCKLISTEDRLTASSPKDSIDALNDPVKFELQFLQTDDVTEQRVSHAFHEVFGQDLILDRGGGQKLYMYVGDRPVPQPGSDRVSSDFLNVLRRLPLAHKQGDGMRAYITLLLKLLTAIQKIILLDEPEAFLHPPQMRMFARKLPTYLGHDTQIFIATHSGDIVRGLLQENCDRLRFLRVTRVENKNFVGELDNQMLSQVWSDSLIRHSNLLDGLFHDRTVVAESDGDCKFYSSVLFSSPSFAESHPDVVFTSCGGKHRFPVTIRALRSLGVPVSAIADLDILDNHEPLKSTVEALGGEWGDFKEDWQIIFRSVSLKQAELTISQVKEQIFQLLDNVTGRDLTEETKKKIIASMQRASPWKMLKSFGAGFIPAGEAQSAFSRLNQNLKAIGLHMVEIGEMENFDRSVNDHGPKWVNAVLDAGLYRACLDPARQFMDRVVL